MDDQAIIELYFARDEDAIRETNRRYGAYCRRIALNILTLREDAEECVSDTYHAAWNAMPPARPGSLRAFLGRITRNLAITRYRAQRAQKRFAGLETMLSELDECLPARQDTEGAFEQEQLAEAIAAWLRSLDADGRALFVRRYWYGDAVKTLAGACGAGENQTAQRLRRLRTGLRAALEKGGFSV